MSLTVVSTPIGNPGDITLRAIETLKNSDAIICEELKPARILLKTIGSDPSKEMHQLNEHSKPQDLAPLVSLCREKKVALISDCGTPGFCDPGADLIEACRSSGIHVEVNPGVSSLMTLLSLSGEKLKEFHFVGFLPAEKTARGQKIASLRNMRVPFLIMDTPYRLEATLKDLAGVFGEAKALLGADLTADTQRIEKAKLKELAGRTYGKAPFVLMIFP